MSRRPPKGGRAPVRETLCRVLAFGLAVLLALSIGVMFVAIGAQVVARGAFGTSVLWLEDLLTSAFTVSIFSGIALAFRQRAHLATSVIPDLLPDRVARAFGMGINLLALCAMAGLFWYGIDFVRNAFGHFTPVLRVPLGWVYMIVPVSAAASILFILDTTFPRKDTSK